MTVRGKTLEVTTYSQCNWDSLDNVDSGFTYTSATEIATKMYSRQCILINGAGFSNTTADFNVTDAPQFCSQVRISAMLALCVKMAFKHLKSTFHSSTQALTLTLTLKLTLAPLST